MISIVIPVYNEAELIKPQLLKLQKQISSTNFISEIIVVDGGSTDETWPIATRLNFIQLVKSERGRAKQMNTGAKIATQPILYFLHVDSTPPPDFDRLIIEKVKKNQVAGCFCMKFNSSHPWLILMSWLTKINHPACRGGDQSLFISKTLFDEVGGFDEAYFIYEDNIMVAELYKRNKFTVIQQWLTTSPRLYEQFGVLKLQWIYIVVYFKKWRGAEAEEIYSYFKRKVKTQKKLR